MFYYTGVQSGLGGGLGGLGAGGLGNAGLMGAQNKPTLATGIGSLGMGSGGHLAPN